MRSLKKRGYTARPAVLDDVGAAVEMFNAWSRHMFGTDQQSLNDVRTEWRTPGFDLASDTQLVFCGTQLVGYVEFWNLSAPYDRPRFLGRVHPEHVGRGIGSALVDWAEERAGRSLPLAPVDAPVTLSQDVWEQDQAAQALLQARGYVVAGRGLRMRTVFNGIIPEPVWPTGIAIRTFDPEHDLEPLVRAVDDVGSDHWGDVQRPVNRVSSLHSWRFLPCATRGGRFAQPWVSPE